MSRTKRNRRFQYANQHASIQTRPNVNAQIGGESFTANREDELAASIFTDSKNATAFALQLGVNASDLFAGRSLGLLVGDASDLAHSLA